MGKHIKGASKRMTCRKKYKIARKVREHNRKKRKEAKQNPKKGKKNKDFKVPNSAPFKEEVLKEAEDHKRRLEEERQLQKERRKKQREKLKMQKRNLDSLVADAQKRAKEFNRKTATANQSPEEYTGGKPVESSLKAYYKEFKKVVDAADVILQVLDARDPLGSRCPQVESAVLSAGSDKRLVLVVNKIDLVPKENVEKWLKYLRNEFPTVAFKASTQSQQEHLSRSNVAVTSASEELLKSSRCLGADMLMKLLGNYCRNKDIKTTIRVGVVGFPNTGKSSIINSLKRSKACHVGAMPGITKAMQEVQLDKHIRLLDSPGIVMAPGTSDTSVILHNCVKIESLEDPVTPAAAILKRCNKEQMMLHYGISSYSDVNEFLSLLATRQGRLKKGGVPDTKRAATTLLQDWNTGKITYYTHPPEDHQHTHVSAEIVSEMSKEFDINALLEDEQQALKDLKTASSNDMVIVSEGPTDGVMEESDEEMGEAGGDGGEDEEEEEVMEEDKEEMESLTVTAPNKSKSKSNKTSSVENKKEKKSKAAASSQPGSEQLNRSRKQDFKKMKKKRKKADAVAGKLSTAMEDAFASLGKNNGEDYDFDVDFK